MRATKWLLCLRLTACVSDHLVSPTTSSQLPVSLFLTTVLTTTTYCLTHAPAQPATAAAAGAELIEGSAALTFAPSPEMRQMLSFVGLLSLQWQLGGAFGLLLGAVMPSVDAALELGKVEAPKN